MKQQQRSGGGPLSVSYVGEKSQIFENTAVLNEISRDHSCFGKSRNLLKGALFMNNADVKFLAKLDY
jgi:hypothetical protein